MMRGQEADRLETQAVRIKTAEEEEEEEEEGLFKADAMNEKDPERDRATPEEEARRRKADEDQLVRESLDASLGQVRLSVPPAIVLAATHSHSTTPRTLRSSFLLPSICRSPYGT